MNNTKSSTTRVMIAEAACSGGSSSDTADYSSSSSSIIAKSPNNVLEFDNNMIQMVGDDTNKEIVTTVVTKRIPSKNSISTCDKKKDGERQLLTTLDLDIPSMDDSTSSDKPKSFQLLPIIKSNKEQHWTKDSTLSVVQIPYISPSSSASSSSSIVSSTSKSSSSFKHIFKSSLNVVSKHISKTKRLSASLGMYDEEEEEEEEYASKGHNDNEEGSSSTTGITTSSAKANKDEDVVREKEQTTTVDISDMIQHEEWDNVLQYVSTSKGIDDIKCQLNKDYSCSSTTNTSNAATNSTSTKTTATTTTTKTATSTTSAVSSSFNLLQLSLMYNPPMKFLNILKEFQPNLLLSTTCDNEQTPLHIACSWGVPSNIIKFLIDWSTSSSASQVHLLKKDSNGNIPLHLLCGVMWPHLQKQQRQQKEKQIDSETTTSVQNFNSCIKLLIKYCPQSVSVMNNDGIMPLQYLPPIVASEWICYSLKEQVFVAKKAMFVKQVMM